MTYEEVVSIIENKRRFGNLPGIEVSRKILGRLGNPQNGLSFVQVAGTNGKGSAAAFLHEILKQSGLKTGLFTSPHLSQFTERIRINGEPIPKETAARLGAYLLEQEFGVFPTMFDYCLAMALLYFKAEKCDIAVLETGLGGRLDSTTAVGCPAVSIITKIGYDHTAILGNSLEKIALEKAGILKRGTYAVLESQEEEAEKVLLEACQEKEIPYQVMDPLDIKNESAADNLKPCFSYKHLKNIEMRMLGIYQYENAAAAAEAAWQLQKKGYAVTDNSIRRGIEQTIWPGRMEVLSQDPFFMVDGAHNANGVRALYDSLCSLFPGEKFCFFMGVMADKDYMEMVEIMLPLASRFYTVTPESERALEGQALAACIREKGVPAEHMKYISQAAAYVRDGSREKIIAFGSLYFIGELRAIYLKN